MDSTDIWTKVFVSSLAGSAHSDALGTSFNTAVVSYAASIADAAVRELEKRKRKSETEN
jgi:hypothetical protein